MTATLTATVSSEDDYKRLSEHIPIPGVVLIFAERRPCVRVFRLEGKAIELGRTELSVSDILDSGISRKHLRLAFDGATWLVSDLSSRNGTYADARRVEGEARVPSGSVVR